MRACVQERVLVRARVRVRVLCVGVCVCVCVCMCVCVSSSFWVSLSPFLLLFLSLSLSLPLSVFVCLLFPMAARRVLLTNALGSNLQKLLGALPLLLNLSHQRLKLLAVAILSHLFLLTPVLIL